MSSEPCNITSPSSQSPSLPSHPPSPPPPIHHSPLPHTMDTDWCLHCSRRFVSHNSPPSPSTSLTLSPDPQDGGLQGAYCSQECFQRDHPNSSVPSLSHFAPLPLVRDAPSPDPIRWMGNDHAGILAWARDVSPGLPSDDRDQTPSHPRKTSRPKLLSVPHRRPLPPSLSVASPHTVRPEPSKPIRAPYPSSSHPFPHRSLDSSSITTSLLTDSVATPVSTLDHPLSQKTSLLGALATQVRSWVAPTRLPAKPDRAPHGPSIHGIDPPPFTVFARAHRGPLAILDEDILPSTAIGKHDDWDNEGDLLAGWYASRVVVSTDDHKPKVPFRPTPAASPLDIDDHPAFRTRGRKPSRAYAAASSFYAYA